MQVKRSFLSIALCNAEGGRVSWIYVLITEVFQRNKNFVYCGHSFIEYSRRNCTYTSICNFIPYLISISVGKKNLCTFAQLGLVFFCCIEKRTVSHFVKKINCIIFVPLETTERKVSLMVGIVLMVEEKFYFHLESLKTNREKRLDRKQYSTFFYIVWTVFALLFFTILLVIISQAEGWETCLSQVSNR